MSKNQTASITVKLRDNVDYFTINDIIEEAKSNFGFDYAEIETTFHKTLRRKIERALVDCQPRPGTENTRKTQYARKDVYQLLDHDLKQYFIKISRKKNESDLNSARQDKRSKASTNLENNAVQQKNVDSINSFKKEYTEIFAETRTPGTPEEMAEIDYDLECKKLKHEIFNEFLFDAFFGALIDFNEEAYKNDWNNQPDPDDPYPSEIEKEACYRLSKKESYYTPKVDLKCIFEELLKELKQRQSQNQKENQNQSSIFKEK